MSVNDKGKRWDFGNKLHIDTNDQQLCEHHIRNYDAHVFVDQVYDGLYVSYNHKLEIKGKG